VHLTGSRIASFLIAVATAIVIVTAAVVPFLTPQWVSFEQGRAEATAWTGYTTEELRTATDAILSDLVFGGDFDVNVADSPVLKGREQAHMSDVRTVFRGLWLLAAISIVVLIAATRRHDRGATWRAVRSGALVLTGGVVVLGVISFVAFDQLFEMFHEIFFPPGSYLFDPTTDRLVQLFPFRFWDETSTVVGVVIIVIAIFVAVVAGRRAAQRAGSGSTAGLAVSTELGR
jgi:integral membrane protein (TIGR01906 family)